MDFAEVVLKRRMVRHFTAESVAPATIDHLLELARHAPSAGFTQGQSFIVVTKPETRAAIATLCGEKSYTDSGFDPFISGAPVLVIPCTSEAAYRSRYSEPDKTDNPNPDEQYWPVPFWHMDIGCAVMVLLLGVVDAGLGAGFAGIMDNDALRALLHIPADVTPVGVIPIGHRAPDKPSSSLKRGRKAQMDFVHHEQW
ncbi:MAG: nitroreductase family protein [Ktedonobacterales bacterium]|nr:nitroreductase family protein [Ktedonobacterales bacterium]